jgi:SOS response regulatory protein OraA/RecX
MARELLEKKAYKWKGLEPRVARQKMSQYLAGKGFGWDVITDLLKSDMSTSSDDVIEKVLP